MGPGSNAWKNGRLGSNTPGMGNGNASSLLRSQLERAVAMPLLALAFIVPWVSIAIYVLVAVIWLIPDRRIEHALRES